MKQMWRQNPFPEENQDSDQCISDDEDGDRKFSRNPRNPFQESRTSKNVQDEFFASPKKVLDEISDEEIISDEEENNELSEFSFISKAATSHHEYEVDNQDGASTWDTVLKETKELMCFRENESHASNSEAKKNLKGSGGKVKPRFSFHFHPDKEEVSLLTTAEGKKKVPQVLEGLEDLDHGPTELSITERLEGLQKAKKKQSEYHHVSSSTSSIGPRNMEHPMAEILDGLLQNNGPFKETPRKNYKIKGKRLRVNAKKNISSLKHRSLGSEEQPEALDSGTSSEEEGDEFLLEADDQNCFNVPHVQGDEFLLEADDQNCLKLATSKNEGQMIIDRFHDALDAAAGECHEPTFAISKQTGTGYHGRLQQVMQNERERLMEFLKQSHGRRTTHDEARCIDVKILSRYLDAKLAVCQCSFTDNIKRSQSAQSLPQELVTTELRKTIIFSSKASDNIDLEVESFIRVHPPWKEVKVLGKEESIILCTYFSQIPI